MLKHNLPHSAAPTRIAIAVVEHEGRYLIGRRPEGAPLAGLWEFPGGKVETGETFQACLIREIAEELDIEIAVDELLEEITHSYPEKVVRLCFYNCRLIAGEPKAVHVQAWKWVTRAELRKEEFPAADAKLIERLVQGELWRGQRG